MRRIILVHVIILASLCHAPLARAQAAPVEPAVPDAPVVVAEERPARAAPTDVELNEEERAKFKGFERVPRARALQLRAGLQVMGEARPLLNYHQHEPRGCNHPWMWPLQP